MPKGVTFNVEPEKKFSGEKFEPAITSDVYLRQMPRYYREIAYSTSEGTVRTPYNNGFIGACMTAYEQHMHLVLKPDDVWIAILTALARYVIHVEASLQGKLKSIFITTPQDQKIDITVLVEDVTKHEEVLNTLSNKVENHIKSDMVGWMECNFSTTTPRTKLVSKLIMMGAFQDFFIYRVRPICGLPKVTLEGTLGDWEQIHRRVARMASWGDSTLSKWSGVLDYVLEKFVDTYKACTGSRKCCSLFTYSIDLEFWKRIANIKREDMPCSGGDDVDGWILAFVGFTKHGAYVLRDLSNIRNGGKYGEMSVRSFPEGYIAFPITMQFSDYTKNVTCFAGSMMMSCNLKSHQVAPTHDWVLVDEDLAKAKVRIEKEEEEYRNSY